MAKDDPKLSAEEKAAEAKAAEDKAAADEAAAKQKLIDRMHARKTGVVSPTAPGTVRLMCKFLEGRYPKLGLRFRGGLCVVNEADMGMIKVSKEWLRREIRISPPGAVPRAKNAPRVLTNAGGSGAINESLPVE